MESFWRAVNGQMAKPNDYEGMEFWSNPKRTGWLTKQGEYIKTWLERELSTRTETLYFIADSEEKEDWVNSI
ncbi:hypothetical protein UlMin_015994 [Ulmus minor]